MGVIANDRRYCRLRCGWNGMWFDPGGGLALGMAFAMAFAMEFACLDLCPRSPWHPACRAHTHTSAYYGSKIRRPASAGPQTAADAGGLFTQGTAFLQGMRAGPGTRHRPAAKLAAMPGPRTHAGPALRPPGTLHLPGPSKTHNHARTFCPGRAACTHVRRGICAHVRRCMNGRTGECSDAQSLCGCTPGLAQA